MTYTLDQASTIRLAVYNIHGKLEKYLIHQEQKASGTHQVRLNEGQFVKGMYLIYLETAEGLTAIEKWVKME